MQVVVLFALLGVMSMLPSGLSKCADKSVYCKGWARRGYCVKTPDCMLTGCCKSCLDEEPCKRVVDVVMVVDESTSVRKYNFRKMKQFISDLVLRYNVKENGAHFAIVTFATQPRVPIALNAYTKVPELQRAIRYIKYYKGRRYTGRALDAVRRQVFNTCADRKKVPDVMVLFTNGKSRDHATAVDSAKFLKKSGVEIICVAVGTDEKFSKTFINQLKELASKPQLVFQTHFNAMEETIENEIVRSTCKAADPCRRKQCVNNGKCTSVGNTFKFKCICPKGYTGHKCEIDPCTKKPCLNSAKCTITGSTFKCTCVSGYGGKTCAAPINLNGMAQSAILGNNPAYLKQLGKWLPSGRHSWKRCWRGSVDGWAASVFHKGCNGKGATITIIQVGQYVFGGYSSVDWQGSGWSNTASPFIFSLKNKYNVAPFKSNVYRYMQYAVYRNNGYGPTFGGSHDLYIANNAGHSTSSATNFGYTYRPPSGYRYSASNTKALLAGSYTFKPTEVEVFYRG